jgi:hypothetical protein
MVGFLTEGCGVPVFGWGEEEPVEERAGCSAAKTVFRSEEGAPAGFDDPVNDPSGMGKAQGSNRRQRVQNVSHGAQPNHEQAELGLHVQTLIFSQRRMG